VVAVDGKSTALPCPENPYEQRHTHGDPCVVRTFTVTLVSSAAKPCLDALPIPAVTNEMGHFPEVLHQLDAAYGKTNLFRLISADSGSRSAANAALVVTSKKDYLFAVKDNQPSLLAEMTRVLGARTDPDASSDDARGNGSWIRRVYVSDEMAGWPGWEHLGTKDRPTQEAATDPDAGQGRGSAGLGRTVVLKDQVASAASTASAWPSTFTGANTWSTRPSASMSTVVRITPSVFLP
jgi:hypothetical protein